MTIFDYKEKIKQLGFKEFPDYIIGGEIPLSDFLDFSEADSELKIYLTEMIICRCFSASNQISFLNDFRWLVNSFMNYYITDIPKPWLSSAIKKAVDTILNGDVFTDSIMGTTFMFGVIESYAKYFLGYDPLKYDFFDNEAHKPFRMMSIGKAIKKLKKTNLGIAKSIQKLDNFRIRRLQEFGIEEKRWIKSKMNEKLSLVRNAMLHGEVHIPNEGYYLVALYILFYLHDIRI